MVTFVDHNINTRFTTERILSCRIMKLLLVAILAILATAHAEEGAARLLKNSGVKYRLYTGANPTSGQIISSGDASSLSSSNFNSSRPTRIITHGWQGNEQQSAVALVRAAYINAGDYNVITIDWNAIQSVLSRPPDTVRNAGGIIAEFLDFLQRSGLNPATTQLAGHSLGAHVVSYAARVANGTYEAVVGLDPAGADFEKGADAISVGIQSGDASHVAVIHTNGGRMGLRRAAGDSDYYANGGRSQPGCVLDIFGICAHFRAPMFFAESITNPTGFPTVEDSSTFLGGQVLSTRARGSYSVVTRSNPPFALG